MRRVRTLRKTQWPRGNIDAILQYFMDWGVGTAGRFVMFPKSSCNDRELPGKSEASYQQDNVNNNQEFSTTKKILLSKKT